MKRRLLLFVVLIAPVVTGAQTETNRLPEIVVTGTRVSTPQEETPTAVSVITADQIERLHSHTVAEALRTSPGVTVSQTGQPGGQTSVFLRGANSEHTLVLIDGVRVNDAFNGRFDFANLAVDNVERIEVLRGPQSALYGSDAMGGVINVVTRRGTAGTTGSLTQEFGSFDSLRSRAAFAGSWKSWDVTAGASYFSTDNDRLNSSYHVANASVRAGVQLLDRLDCSVLGLYRKSYAGTPNDRFTNDPNDFQRNENFLIATTLQGQLTEWWDARLQVSHARERMVFSGLEPNPPWFSGDLTAHTLSDRTEVDLQNVFEIGRAHRILFGGTLDYLPVDYLSSSTWGDTTIDRSITAQALYGQYEFMANEALTLTTAGRVDDHSAFGVHLTGRSGARFTIARTATILRASVGTGFHAPSIADLYYPGFSNPDLRPEESFGWDAGVEQPLCQNRMRLGATVFHNEFDDLIAYSGVSFRPENIEQARTLGVETFAAWQPHTNWTLRAAYTWLPVAEDLSSHTRLIRRPRHTGSLEAQYAFLNRFRADGAAQWAGDSPDRDYSTSPASDVNNPGHITINLGLTYDACRYASVFFRVENLFDDHYESVYGFPSLGRSFWGGATVRF